jgi:hypothetical protein
VAFSPLVGPSELGFIHCFCSTQIPVDGFESKLITTHLATHQKNTHDLYGFFHKLFHHNPQVRGSNP